MRFFLWFGLIVAKIWNDGALLYAWLDLKDKKARGEHVNDRDLKKHKNDVFRLLRIIDRGISIETSGLVRENIVRFVSEIANESIPFEQFDLPFGMDEALSYLRDLYSLWFLRYRLLSILFMIKPST